MASENTLALRAIQPSGGRWVHGGSHEGHMPCVLKPQPQAPAARKPKHIARWSYALHIDDWRRAHEEQVIRARKRIWRGPWSPRLKAWLGGFDRVFPRMVRGLQAVSFDWIGGEL